MIQESLKVSAFVGTNPTDESIVPDLSVVRQDGWPAFLFFPADAPQPHDPNNLYGKRERGAFAPRFIAI